MDTSEMRAFVCVAEHQSFSGAAVALALTPSAVSKLISRLEERLGIRLVHRTTRRVALTSEGDVYFARARQILADIDEMEMEVTRSRGSPRGHLRVNTNTGFGIHQLAPALPDSTTGHSGSPCRCRNFSRVTPTSMSSFRSPIELSIWSPITPT